MFEKIMDFQAEGKSVDVYSAGIENKPIIYFNAFEGERQLIIEELRERKADFNLVVIGNLNWNHDMSPWASAAVIKGDLPFTGGGESHLGLMTERILPVAEKALPAVSARGIAGYSLAGLFAIYALYKTESFSLAASMSGSMWFEGFVEFALTHELKRKPEYLFFSLGDRESMTKNVVLGRVGSNTETIVSEYKRRGIETEFTLSSGNHFKDVGKRIADGLMRVGKR